MIIFSLLLALPASAAQRTLPVVGAPETPLTAVVGEGLGAALPAALPAAAVPAAAPLLPAAPAISAPGFLYKNQDARAAKPAGSAAERPLPGAIAGADEVVRAAVAAPSILGAAESLDTIYFGKGRKNKGGGDGAWIVNDDGIPLNKRAAVYYKEVTAATARLSPRVDLADNLDGVADSYAEVWAKLKTLETLAAERHVEDSNIHLNQTLIWVDGILQGRGKTTAVHTYRVYFHDAPNRQSHVEEGIRRADAYLAEVVPYFNWGGKADEELGDLDDVVLSFDTRGYPEIRAHLEARGREIEEQTGGRITFRFVDDLVRGRPHEPAVRRELRELIHRFRVQQGGLQKISEGVLYSRYVGLLLELETISTYLDRGYQIVSSGHELFDRDGKYVTELDAVVRAPDGTVSLVEARAARVPLPLEKAVSGKIRYKLEAYRKHRALLEKELGAPLRVVFSMDVGRNTELSDYLSANASALSEEFGFPISFMFLEIGPDQGRRGGRRS